MKDGDMEVGRVYVVKNCGQTFDARLLEKIRHRYPATGKLIYVYRFERCSNGVKILLRHQKFIVSEVDAA